MASTGIFELLPINGGTGAVRSDDVLPLVDVHDTTQAVQGSTVKITLAQLYRTETTPVTVSTPLPDIAQTWNAGAVAFTAVRVNITNTASAAGSKLLDLQVGGVSKWSVAKDGALTSGTVNGQTISSAASFTGSVDVAGRTTLTVAGESLRLRYDATNYVSFAVSSTGGLVITPLAGQAVTVSTFAATAKSTLSQQTRVGDVLRVDAIAVPTTTGLTGAGLDLYYDAQADAGMVRAWDYTGTAAKPLNLVASVVTATVPDYQIAGKLTVTRTAAAQLQLNYDASNNLAITVSSAGVVSYSATGASARHAFDKPVVLGTDPSSTSTAKLRVGVSAITAPTTALTHAALIASPNANSGHALVVVSDSIGRNTLFISQGYSSGVSGSAIILSTDGSTNSIDAYITGSAASGPLTLGASALTVAKTGQSLGFYGATAIARQTVTGSRGGNAALASIATALASLGLLTDGTTV